MDPQIQATESKTALITGAGRRIGAEIAASLQRQGYHVVIHYNGSETEAKELTARLNDTRPDSASCVQADLSHIGSLDGLVEFAVDRRRRLDVLVNNASVFYPTPVENTTEADWDRLLNCNLKAPFFLAKAAAPELTKVNGCIVNIVDIHAQRALKDHPAYSISKAGLAAMTTALAKELGPTIRVNGVSPGAILWPENDLAEAEKKEILARIILNRCGESSDIAKTVLFLVDSAPYITGQIIAVDGGRSLYS